MWRRLTSVSVLALMGVGSTAAIAHAQTTRVTVSDIDYSRHRVVVHRGAIVVWKFADPQVSHNVTSRGRSRFRSSHTMLTGTYRVRFRHPGVYRYVCTIHPNMRGRVVVR